MDGGLTVLFVRPVNQESRLMSMRIRPMGIFNNIHFFHGDEAAVLRYLLISNLIFWERAGV
jgi:hypothetical protein